MLGKLPAQQQVVLRQYIATLRANMVDLEDEVRTLKEPPAPEGEDRGHFHGEQYLFYAVMIHCQEAAQFNSRSPWCCLLDPYRWLSAARSRKAFLTFFLYSFSITTCYSKRRASLVSQPLYFLSLLNALLSNTHSQC